MPAETLAQGDRLAAEVAGLRDQLGELWTATPPDPPASAPRVGRWRRLSNARAAGRLVDALAGELACLPDDEAARGHWRESVRGRLQGFGQQRLGWPAGYRRLLFADDFFRASVEFARRARAFDSSLRAEQLGQALRNVWIGNSLQALLGLPVRLGSGLFAYSMLYPFTDNLLDDPQVSACAKREFNRRFGRRLAGEAAPPLEARDERVFRLVGHIESEFARRDHPGVYESLLAIHRAQEASLAQQGRRRLREEALLALSCEKGGTSVLADLFLVAGDVTANEARFAFAYGVFLQLLDDLQDVEDDLEAGHQTLFTRAAERGSLDAITAKLARFIDVVLDGDVRFAAPRFVDRKDLIRRNCHALLLGAVAAVPSRFTRRFRRALERGAPLSLAALARLRRRAEHRFREAASALQARSGAPTALDLVLGSSPGPPAVNEEGAR